MYQFLPAPFRCVVSPESGYCLALTRDQALVWPYSLSHIPPSPKDVFTFTIPSPAYNSADPLPLGTFVSRSTAGEPGLVVVVPTTGKIIFWETLSTVAILGLTKQKPSGLQGSIPSMLSGECAVEVINADPAGIIITMSSGHFAHVTVRDPQGKPAINAQFIRSTSGGGGILGGIRNVLSGSAWRRKIVAAKAGRSWQRGQRDIVIATSSGTIELWDIHWNHSNNLKNKVDVRHAAVQELERYGMALGEDSENTFQLLDVAFREELNAVDLANDEKLLLWALVAIVREGSLSHYIIGLDIFQSSAEVGRIFPVDYAPSGQRFGSQWSPRIVVPKPGDTAFVLFEDGIVLASLVTVSNSPSTQLLVGVENVPSPFQDYVRFKDGFDYAVSGYGFEDSLDAQQRPSCIVVIQNFGLARFTALPRPTPGTGVEEGNISAKSRLEQLVFCDNFKSNPFNFTDYKELYASSAALEDAALQINDEILKSSSRFVATTAPSLEQQMRFRASALEKLAVFLKEAQAELTYLTRWVLLWGAEKMAAQRAIWRVHETLIKDGSNQQTHLERVLEHMGDKFKTKLDPNSGETDPVRHWFIHDTWRMEYVVPWILNSIRDSNRAEPKVGLPFATQIWEASELSLAVLETVFQFREENAPLYGLEYAYAHRAGTTAPRYSELPEFWTSQHINCMETDALLDVELNTCLQWKQESPQSDANEPQAIRKLKQNIPREYKVLSQIWAERTEWCAAQSDPETVATGQSLQNSNIERRRSKLFKMAGLELTDEAVALAEQFNDMKALVELLTILRQQRKERCRALGADAASLEEVRVSWRKLIDQYFEKFGRDFGDAFFTRQIAIGAPGNLLRMREYQEHVTEFLRERPAYAKVGWMNEVTGERDYGRASKALSSLAAGESDLWSKKVELSMAKLASLALLQETREEPEENLKERERFDREINICVLQDSLYEHILPALHGAIDESAGLELANEQFSQVVVQSRPALREALQRGIAKVVGKIPTEPDELIDVFTLIDPVRLLEHGDDIAGHEISYAFDVLNYSNLAQSDPNYHQLLEKLIWRRCMIRDDWETINDTNQKGDEEMESVIRSTVLFRTLAEYAAGMLHKISHYSEINWRLTCNLPCLLVPRISSNPAPKLYSPSQILDAPLFPHRLASRLVPEQRVYLENDLNEENEQLRAYIERNRLEEWYSFIMEMLLPDEDADEAHTPDEAEDIDQNAALKEQSTADGEGE